MAEKNKKLQKVFSFLATLSLVLQSGSGIFLARPVFAEDVTPTPEVNQPATPTVCPIEEPTPVPTQEVTPSSSDTAGQVNEPTIQTTPTQEITPTIDSTATEVPTLSVAQPVPEVTISVEPTSIEASPTEAPIPEPTIEVVEKIEGRLSVAIIEETQAELPPIENACIWTDKPDYQPTEKVLISGTGFVAGATYLLVISSQDSPPVNHEAQVTADEKGEFFYSYQLDGIYRPNYKVEAKDKDGNTVAATTFTDDSPAGLPFFDSFGTVNNSDVTGWDESYAEITGGSGEDQPRDVSTNPKFAKIGRSGDNDGYIRRTINASGFQSLQLKYYWKGDSDAGSGDKGVIEYCLGSSCTSFPSGNKLAEHSLNNTSWSSQQVINLPSSLNNSTFRIRFRNNANSNNEYFRVDDIEITGIIAPAWPNSWITPSCSTDPAGDKSPAEVDLIGDDSNPAVGYASDSNYRYFRERLNGDPGTFKEKAWVVLFQTSAPQYQYLGSLNGKDDKVQLWENTTPGGSLTFNPILNDPAETKIWEGDSSLYARRVNLGGGKYFVDWAIPLTAFSGTGITDSTTKYFATSADANNFNKDHLNCYEGPTPTPTATATPVPTETPTPTPNPTATPTPTSFCGDGNVNQQSEQCDDGNQDNNDYCSNSCTFNQVCLPDVNMVVNGDFETPIVANGAKWDIYNMYSPMLGWTTSWHNGSSSYNGQDRPEPAYLELHRGVNGWLSYSGSQHAELDTDWDGPGGSLNGEPASVKISQTLSTIPGYRYEIKYAYSPRPNESAADNKLQSWWGGVSLGIHQSAGGGNTSWTEYTFEKVATANTTNLEFTDEGTPNSLGTFIDKVSVVCLGPNTGTLTVSKSVKDGPNDSYSNTSPNVSLFKWGVDLETPDRDMGTSVDLTAGSHTITENSVSGYKFDGWHLGGEGGSCTSPEGTTLPINIEITAGRSTSIVLCNSLVPGSISGYKYEDINGNGQEDEGEGRLAGWTIFLDANENGDLDEGEISTSTDSSGNYTFNNLLPGGYRVCEVLQSGWVVSEPTEGSCKEVNVGAGEEIQGINFGNFKLGKIQGRKYEDLNKDGTHDTGEPYLNEWTIRLYKKSGSSWNPIDSKITGHTGTDGQYRFEGLALGQYKICEVLKDGWVQTAPTGSANRQQPDEAPRCRTTSITQSSQVRNGMSFGNIHFGSISGYKYEDTNGNGQEDEGETGRLAGWTIRLKQGDTEIDSTTTGEDGTYSFVNVIPGDYQVCEVLNEGWIATDPSGGNCKNVTVGAGQNLQVNFGNFKLGKVTACKYEDLDGDGVKDADESWISGVSVMLQRQTGEGGWEGSSWVSTKQDGCYSWVEIGPGVYRVLEDLTDSDLAGYSPTDGFTTQDDYRVSDSITMVSGGSFTKDFFNEPPAGLVLSKTNDKTGGASAGDTVTYTLTVTNNKRKLVGGVLMDVMPFGFTYVSGSGKINGVAAAPVIIGPMLLWNLGDFDSEEVKTIEYQATVPSGAQGCFYTNLAYASAKKYSGGPTVSSGLAFSKVPIGQTFSYSVGVGGAVLGVATEGQVLGATLPAAGSNTEYLILAMIFILAGLAIRQYSAKKYAKGN